METPRNEFLWRKAKKRAGFKNHLTTYLVINAGLWILYLAISSQNFGRHTYPWPIWTSLGWGIGLVSHFFSAYGNFDHRKMVEKEYEKLLREQG